MKLGDICQITTGKLDANAQVDNGIYPFFTCAEQPFKIDSFAFDTEALLILGMAQIWDISIIIMESSMPIKGLMH